MNAFEFRCQKLRKIIADGVEAIVRLEGRYYSLDDVFREEGRLLTLMVRRRRIRREGGKPLPRREEFEYTVLRARRLVYEHSPKYLAQREAAKRLQDEGMEMEEMEEKERRSAGAPAPPI